MTSQRRRTSHWLESQWSLYEILRENETNVPTWGRPRSRMLVGEKSEIIQCHFSSLLPEPYPGGGDGHSILLSNVLPSTVISELDTRQMTCENL